MWPNNELVTCPRCHLDSTIRKHWRDSSSESRYRTWIMNSYFPTRPSHLFPTTTGPVGVVHSIYMYVCCCLLFLFIIYSAWKKREGLGVVLLTACSLVSLYPDLDSTTVEKGKGRGLRRPELSPPAPQADNGYCLEVGTLDFSRGPVFRVDKQPPH